MNERSHLVVFRVVGERFALPSDRVERVLERVEVRTLPWLPRQAAGVLRYRDEWIPVVDPAVALGLADEPEARPTALVLKRGATRFALTVDEAVGRRDLKAHRLRAAAGSRTVSPGDDEGRVSALSDDEGLIALLDPDDLFYGEPLPDHEMQQNEDRRRSLSVVAFRAGGSDLCLPVDRVSEVLPLSEPSAVDDAPAWVSGVIQMRERAVPVVDLRALFGLDVAEPGAGSRILVVDVQGLDVAFLVDDVRDVKRVPAAQVREAPAYLREVSATFVESIARVDDRLLLVLAADRMLDDAQREALTGLGARKAASGKGGRRKRRG